MLWQRPLLIWRFDTLCTSGFVDDVIFAHNGQAQPTAKGRMLKVTHHGAARCVMDKVA